MWECRETLQTDRSLPNLNTLSGRSYRDIAQYPVFPWLVSEYPELEEEDEEEGLDLNDAKSYRDLGLQAKIDQISRQNLILRGRFTRESCRSRRDLQISLGNLGLRMRFCLEF